jgi:cytoskeletal protein CcmA (bactofilin family)
MEKKPEETNDPSSLETNDSTQAPVDDVNALESTTDALADDDAKKAQADTPKQGSKKKIQGLITHINVYVLLFLLIIVLAAGFVLIGIQKNKKANAPTTVNTQTLSAEELKKLSESEQKIGDPKSTLSIESNAIFSGKVLVRDSLDVAGTIKVGGALSLPGISVSGASTFDQITANNLTITGNTAIQGQLTIQKGLTSSGGASFGGPLSAPQITTGSLQLTGALEIINHLDGGGGTPNITGGAGLSGSDTAGKINNVGGTGCNVKVTFAKRYNSTPYVVISPANAAAATSDYYVSQESATGFSVCIAGGGGSGLNFSYMVIE